MKPALLPLILAACAAAHALPASAVTVTFFSPSQPASLLTSNITSRTITSQGYRFTYTVDGYWSSYPGGPPTGRFFSVFWPNGVQAQAITTGTNVGTGANITLKRVDGQPFDLRSFTGKLLANTAATGGAFEIMPQLDGEDAFNDPVMFDASGYAGMSFAHTPMLSGYDTYKLHLWVDWALTALKVVDSSELVPAALQLALTTANTVQLSWPAAAVGYSLQQSPSLEPADWTSVTNAAQLIGPNIQVTVPPTSGARFFRLQNP